MLKFVERFFWIAAAVDPIGENPDEMWDEEDGFFYDVLRLPDGSGTRIKVRSLVGLLPLCATTVIEADLLERYPQIAGQVATFLERNQDLLANIADPLVPGVRAGGSCPWSTRTSCAASWPGCWTRSASWARTGSARSRGGTWITPTPSTCTAQRVPGAVRAGRVDHRDVRRELQLARPGLVPDQPAADPGPAPALPVLRRRPEGRMPDRLGNA